MVNSFGSDQLSIGIKDKKLSINQNISHYSILFINIAELQLIIGIGMKSMIANPVKKAASILLCRSSTQLNSFYDYQVLMLERKGSLSSFGSVLAFPGGKFDPEQDNQLLVSASLESPTIATALRQCFEETGLYLTQNPLVQMSKITDLNEIKLNYIASQFYKSSAPIQKQGIYKKNQQKQKEIFNTMKRISQIIQPKKSLSSFIRLVTVPIIKSRFDAFFYIHKLEQFKFINFMKYAENDKYLHSDGDIVINDQSASFAWLTPIEIVRGFINKSIKLAPPQFIMLNIMTSFQKFAQLSQFLRQCSHNEINMGPNIVSMINNEGNTKQKFPYAATLIGDFQFPYQFCKKNQKNEELISEVHRYKERISKWDECYKNRLLFKKPLQFFQQEYSNQCTIPTSVMSKFMDSNKLIKHLQLYQ